VTGNAKCFAVRQTINASSVLGMDVMVFCTVSCDTGSAPISCVFRIGKGMESSEDRDFDGKLRENYAIQTRL